MTRWITFLCLVWSALALGAADFDGVNDSLSAGSAANLDNLNPLTISAWVYVEGNGSAANGGGGIVAKRRSGGSAGWQLGYINAAAPKDATCRFVYLGDTTNGDWYCQSQALAVNAWHHVLLNGFARTDTSTPPVIYIDGVSQSITQVTPIAVAATSDAAANLRIGGYDNATALAFNGWIENVAIWNAALTADEIDNLARSRVFTTPGQIQRANLCGWWMLNDWADGSTIVSNGADQNPNNQNPVAVTGNPIGRASTNLHYAPGVRRVSWNWIWKKILEALG